MLKAALIMSILVLGFILSLKYSDKIAHDAQLQKGNSTFCGTLTQIENSKMVLLLNILF